MNSSVYEDMDVKISVIMSVYNTKEEYLREAIDSILNQTFTAYEFIIIDDCCNHDTKEILESYHDDRIILVKNEENIGLTASLNIGLDLAKGKYIARMDSDDISMPDRLRDQYQYMEKHADVDILGGWFKAGNKIEKSLGRVSKERRRVRMLFENAGVCHSAAFIRKDFLEENNLNYDINMKKAQDYDLWSRCLDVGRMEVLPKIVLEYRVHNDQISIRNSSEQNYYIKLIRKSRLNKIYSDYTERELEQFLNMDNEILSSKELDEFFMTILKKNKENNFFNNKILKYELSKEWLKIIFGKYHRKNKREFFWMKRTLVMFSPVFWSYFLFNQVLRRI